jgi:hypothetical protein
MSNQLANITPAPLALSTHAIAAQSRATQEVQASLVIAKQFPRNVSRCVDQIVIACGRERLASQALYAYARGGSDISGPSIRLAEAMAQIWGNLKTGWRETDRGIEDGVGYSDLVAYCWDLETNSSKEISFRQRHWRDKKGGKGYPITEERDIYELLANMAQRRVRACILAVIPGDVVEEAEAACDATLHAKADISDEALKKMVAAFEDVGVTRSQIEAKIQRKIVAIQPAQVIQLRKIYASIKDGMSVAGDWFEPASSDIPAQSIEMPKPKKAKAQPETEELI